MYSRLHVQNIFDAINPIGAGVSGNLMRLCLHLEKRVIALDVGCAPAGGETCAGETLNPTRRQLRLDRGQAPGDRALHGALHGIGRIGLRGCIPRHIRRSPDRRTEVHPQGKQTLLGIRERWREAGWRTDHAIKVDVGIVGVRAGRKG